MGTEHNGGRRVTRHGIYADIRGDAGAPPLLFLHGGPGQGCHDFMALQGDLLGRSVRRGVGLRPGPRGGLSGPGQDPVPASSS